MLNTVIADGNGGVIVQLSPLAGAGFNNKDAVIAITREHEQIHADDITAVNKTPSTATNGKPVPWGTIVGLSSPKAMAASEVKATDHSIASLKKLRLNEKDQEECDRLDKYIEELQEYRRLNLGIIQEED